MNTARSHFAAALLADGRVLVVGGWTYTSSAEVYDPGARAFGPTGSMSVSRSRASATRLQDGRVLVTGGAGVAGSVQRAEVWSAKP